MDMGSALLARARKAAEAAYCDYSQFPVGASVLTSEGEVFDGCNIENASYGLACCAERVAIFNAVSSGARQIVMIAVSCPQGSPDFPETLMPCGACRQVMAEFMDPNATVLVDSLRKFELRELLPVPFSLTGR
jgi:cytidine deaminase